MKTYKYLFLGILATLFACSDLEEEPRDLLNPDTFFNSPRDIQTAINGAIGHMAHEEYWGRKLTLTLLLRGDMVAIGDDGTAPIRVEVDEFNMSTDNGMVSAFWPRSYQVIASVNNAIKGATNVTGDPNVIAATVAQAHFIRAFAYYHLVRLFGGIPYLSEPVENVADVASIFKTPEAEVYANIIADLTIAKRDLPETQSSRALPSKATASAYLASVYLTIGNLIENNVLENSASLGLGSATENYQKAYDEAKFVIDNEGAFDLELENDFQDLFVGEISGSSKEPLFTIDYNAFRDGNFGQDYLPALTGIEENTRGVSSGGWSVAVPSIEVYNRWDGRDYRKAVSLDTTAVFKIKEIVNGEEVDAFVLDTFENFPNYDGRNVQRAYIAKYNRFIEHIRPNGRASNLNYMTMRYAEVLLTAAEALNEINGGSAEAIAYVNRIRERARMADGTARTFPEDIPVGTSQNDLRDLIIEERRIELAFEMKRWYDIKRLRIGDEAFSTSGLESRDFKTRDYFMPLPVDEIARNPNIKQNDGY